MIERRRVADWPMQLAQFLTDRASMPFDWRGNNCVTFAAAWIQMATGTPILDVTFDSRMSALRLLAAEGGLEAAVTKRLGAPYAFAQEAGRGDIAIAVMDDEPVLVVVEGLQIAGPGDAGIVLNDRSLIVTAWRV